VVGAAAVVTWPWILEPTITAGHVDESSMSQPTIFHVYDFF
jgi:hypothetical protein